MRYGPEQFHEKYSVNDKLATGEKKKKAVAKPKQKKEKSATPKKVGGKVTVIKEKNEIKLKKQKEISSESPYQTLTWENDEKILTKEKGNVIKVSETEYTYIDRLNEQDLEDINTIKELEKIAKERQK